jgi:3-hydroxy-4-methylanthranilate adenylyltransferase
MTLLPTVHDRWAQNLITGPDDEVLFHFRNRTTTRREFRRRVGESEQVFRALGLAAGSTVALQISPSYTTLHALIALWRCGAQVVLLDHRLTDSETARLLAVTEPQYHAHSGDAGRRMTSFSEEREIVTVRRATGLPAASDHCLIQFSSGSTGEPKVIGRSVASLIAELHRFSLISGMPTRGERLLLLSSMVHSFGLVAGVLHSLSVGVELVFTAGARGRLVAEAAAEHTVDAIFGVPFHYELLCSLPNPPNLPRLRVAVSGGESLPETVADRFRRTYGVAIGDAYGMTETGIIAADLSGSSRPATGPAAPGMRLRIVEGDLEVALDDSPYLFGDQSDRFRDGWLRTFDRAQLDTTHGTLTLAGRSDSLVVVGGLKVDLAEIEDVLCEHPDVTEAVVVYGDTIEAYVGADRDVSVTDLKVWCRQRLAGYKLPKHVQVGGALPRTASGKLLRSQQRLSQLFAAAAQTAAGRRVGSYR